ncbi:hypothetical protein NE237_006468 [Protea cynaroides]|uniref:Uncharacterized protein n=1 Tax=Protea cynaroides TaxID=273540 RepID=A0A9Q0KMM9_9MAGN|nr:hypothetical protein NE237_006468 [Protea cynaroides]
MKAEIAEEKMKAEIAEEKSFSRGNFWIINRKDGKATKMVVVVYGPRPPSSSPTSSNNNYRNHRSPNKQQSTVPHFKKVYLLCLQLPGRHDLFNPRFRTPIL